MKRQGLLIPILMLMACRTPADAKENKDVTKAAATAQAPEMLLQKIIGGIKGEAFPQNFDCKVMSTDIQNVDEVKKWIAMVPRETQKAVHFVAQSPSQQFYAYVGAEKIILHYDYSEILTPKNPSKEAGDAITALKDLLNQKCPFTPKK